MFYQLIGARTNTFRCITLILLGIITWQPSRAVAQTNMLRLGDARFDTSQPSEDELLMSYVAPDMNGLPFNKERMESPLDIQNEIAQLLADYVCEHMTFDHSDDFILGPRLLGMARGLDERNKTALVANAQLRGGRTPSVKPSQSHLKETFPDTLVEMARTVAVQNSDQDKLVAAMLLDIACFINPEHVDAIFERELLKAEGISVDWTWADPTRSKLDYAKADDTPENTVEQPEEHSLDNKTIVDPRRNQASVAGMMVRMMPNGEMIGFSSDIIATVMDKYTRSRPYIPQVQIRGQIGSEMRTSAIEAKRLIHLRYPEMFLENIEFSFGEKYGAKDGGSAGAAFTVLFIALAEDIDIDSDFAMTGDITVDGKIREVGGIAEKVRGAILDGRTLIVIPEINADDLGDLIILHGVENMAEAYIFSADTVDDALAVARNDRNEQIKKSLELTKAMQESFVQKGEYALRNPESIEMLDQALTLAPNNLSAKYLLLASKDELPTRLSMRASIDKTFQAAELIAPFWSDRLRHPNAYELDRQEIRTTVTNLRKVQRLVDPSLQPLIRELNDFLFTCERYKKGRLSPEAMLKAREDLAKVFGELIENRETLEKILRR